MSKTGKNETSLETVDRHVLSDLFIESSTDFPLVYVCLSKVCSNASYTNMQFCRGRFVPEESVLRKIK